MQRITITEFHYFHYCRVTDAIRLQALRLFLVYTHYTILL